MADPSSSDEIGQRVWRFLRLLVTGRSDEASLREQIEEAIDERAGDAENGDDLSAAERQMLKNLLHFGERQIDDVAVPRADMIAFEASGSFQGLVELFREAGHSRVPVFRNNLDDVIGMIHIKDVYARLAEEGRAAVVDPEALLRPVLFVPASMGVLDLLARMRHARTHMAIVIDEYGGTDGLVTIEDLVEEIVGDIEDEHDEAEEGLKALGDDMYEADARIELAELQATLGVVLDEDEEDEVDTVGGMVFMLAGRVPPVGETIVHPSGWRFEVIAGDTRHIQRVRIHPPEVARQEAAAE
ncbi:hemolysin family protein [Sphingoaurantiacus capsulatus]|uniref:Hemolysin family protein n=1 Tax=Sphingoaurantiacus capsulatus TaxID=1771310 RepID=A0ABV7X8J1_9SPHN